MDSWDSSIYGNDAACDWIAELCESQGWSMIDDAFDAVLDVGDETLESTVAEEALAAADVVAWVHGHPSPGEEATEELTDWIEEQELDDDEQHLRRAREVTERVLADPSELRQLWEESGDFEAWEKAVSDLLNRLSE